MIYSLSYTAAGCKIKAPHYWFQEFWASLTSSEWEKTTGPNLRTKRESILNKMKICSQWMLAVAIIGIVMCVIDIELQYRNTEEYVIEETPCSIQTQKDSFPIDSLSKTGYWLVHSVRLIISILSLLNVILVLTYHKLESNLRDLKQNKDPVEWTRFLMLLLFEWPTTWRRFMFWFNLLVTTVHVPPFIGNDYSAERQLVMFLRAVAVFKFLKHNHPMKFDNIMEMVSSISPIDLEESNFTLKTYFVKSPLTCMLAIYCYIVWVFGYIVFVLGSVATLF